MHPLLQRQLKRLGIAAGELLDAALQEQLLDRVSRAYETHDQERELLERSDALASEEMSALYASLRSERDSLDVRVRERTEELRRSESRLASLLSLSADWVWECDVDEQLTYLSESFHQSSGLKREVFLGRSLATITATAPDDATQSLRTRIARREAFHNLTFEHAGEGGVQLFLRISGEPVFGAEGAFIGYRGIGSDVTQARNAERHVQDLARLDGLTKLPNRTMFLGELDRTMARAQRTGSAFAVCFIDLDRFKSINDNMGHAAGDTLLKAMAVRLRDAVRRGDLVARLGGDEFVVLLNDLGPEADVRALAKKLLDAIAEPLDLGSRTFVVTGSIGIDCFPGSAHDASTLIRHADSAMYLAKERGKNNVQIYTHELANKAAQKMAVESELRLALVSDQLRLHYQPKIDMASGEMRSVEALVRWAHPERGLVPPGEFIPLAEGSDLIILLGRWVMHEACRQIAEWRAAGLQAVSVAINLSGRQFADGSLNEDIAAALRAHDVDARFLEVELTESVLMDDPERARHVLDQLHAMGVKIAIDDFGTGYSSLSYLKRFPAQAVKIDRSFVSGLPGDSDDVAITQAVIAMAHSLGLRVIAEGVELQTQLDALREMGCDDVQGYLLGRPMPAEQLALRLLERGVEVITKPLEQ